MFMSSNCGNELSDRWEIGFLNSVFLTVGDLFYLYFFFNQLPLET